jgi:hypothetical protein
MQRNTSHQRNFKRRYPYHKSFQKNKKSSMEQIEWNETFFKESFLQDPWTVQQDFPFWKDEFLKDPWQHFM